jgi:hypothetical protein
MGEHFAHCNESEVSQDQTSFALGADGFASALAAT